VTARFDRSHFGHVLLPGDQLGQRSSETGGHSSKDQGLMLRGLFQNSIVWPRPLFSSGRHSCFIHMLAKPKFLTYRYILSHHYIRQGTATCHVSYGIFYCCSPEVSAIATHIKSPDQPKASLLPVLLSCMGKLQVIRFQDQSHFRLCA
jgi:hypothetical protein